MKAPPPPMQPSPNPTHAPVPRLRSVKIEQGKLNDQANTLADLAKVSSEGPGGEAPQANRDWLGAQGRKGGHSVKDRAQLLLRQGQHWHLQGRQVT